MHIGKIFNTDPMLWLQIQTKNELKRIGQINSPLNYGIKL